MKYYFYQMLEYYCNARRSGYELETVFPNFTSTNTWILELIIYKIDKEIQI